MKHLVLRESLKTLVYSSFWRQSTQPSQPFT